MNTTMISRQVLRFNRARSNLLAMVAFTTINLLLTAMNADFYMLFSATLPQLIFQIGQGMAGELQSNAFLIVGLVASFVVIAYYFICWFLAKRSRTFILAALIFFGIDSLILLFLTLGAGFEASFLLDIAFHGWVLYYLVNGAIAWASLRGVNKDDIDAASKGLAPGATASRFHGENAPDQTAAGEIPLRPDDKDDLS